MKEANSCTPEGEIVEPNPSQMSELGRAYLDNLDASVIALIKKAQSNIDNLSKQEIFEIYKTYTVLETIANEDTNQQILDELISAYANQGLVVQKIKGNCWFGKTMVAVEHDGVQYAIDNHGHEKEQHEEGTLESTIQHLKLIMERHHEMVKAVYEYCCSLNVGDIWVMSGGGCQLQAFFGNNTGYLGILSLDMVDPEENIENDYTEVPTKPYILKPNFEKNRKFFERMSVKNVVVEN